MSSNIIITSGHDIHALANKDSNKPPVIGGYTMQEAPFSMVAHSDGDLLFHTLVDAILAAICDADIGEKYDPSVETWKNHSSEVFLVETFNKMRQQRGKIISICSELVAHEIYSAYFSEIVINKIKKNISAILNIDNKFIGIFFKKAETDNAIKRKEAIGCRSIIASTFNNRVSKVQIGFASRLVCNGDPEKEILNNKTAINAICRAIGLQYFESSLPNILNHVYRSNLQIQSINWQKNIGVEGIKECLINEYSKMSYKDTKLKFQPRNLHIQSRKIPSKILFDKENNFFDEVIVVLSPKEELINYYFASGYSRVLCEPVVEKVSCILGNAKIEGSSAKFLADPGIESLNFAMLGIIELTSEEKLCKPYEYANIKHLLDRKNIEITHINLTFICQTPKIKIHRKIIEESIKKTFILNPETRINIQAKTNEKLDKIGKREAAECYATVSANRIQRIK